MEIRTSDAVFALATITALGAVVGVQMGIIKEMKKATSEKNVMIKALSKIATTTIEKLTTEQFNDISDQLVDEIKFVDIVTNQ